MSRLLLKVCMSGVSPVLRTTPKQNVHTLMNLRSQSTVSTVRALHLSSARHGSSGGGFHRTSDLDKKILVWTKMFPVLADVPDEVTSTKMKKAKDMFRIRVNILMGLATALACIVYIWAGKRAVQQGESINKQNRDRHFEFSKEK